MNTLALTQQTFILSVVTVNQDDSGIRFSVWPILSLTWLAMLIWNLQLFEARFNFWFEAMVNGLMWQIDIYARAGAVVFNTLLYWLLF